MAPLSLDDNGLWEPPSLDRIIARGTNTCANLDPWKPTSV